MLKKLTIIAAVLAMPILATPAIAAAEPTAAVVAVIDLGKVMNKSTAVKSANDQLQAQRDKYQQQISAEEAKLKQGEEDLAKQKTILTKEALAEKQKKFIDEVNKVRKEVQQRKSKLDKANHEALSQVQSTVRQIVEELATEKGFNLAVPTEQLIFAHKDLDISEEVLTRLNEKLPKVELKFE